MSRNQRQTTCWAPLYAPIHGEEVNFIRRRPFAASKRKFDLWLEFFGSHSASSFEQWMKLISIFLRPSDETRKYFNFFSVLKLAENLVGWKRASEWEKLIFGGIRESHWNMKLWLRVGSWKATAVRMSWTLEHGNHMTRRRYQIFHEQ